jgi:hypothetical protein
VTGLSDGVHDQSKPLYVEPRASHTLRHPTINPHDRWLFQFHEITRESIKWHGTHTVGSSSNVRRFQRPVFHVRFLNSISRPFVHGISYSSLRLSRCMKTSIGLSKRRWMIHKSSSFNSGNPRGRDQLRNVEHWFVRIRPPGRFFRIGDYF